MHGQVDGGRVSVQGLANHENGLAMGISAGAEDRDIGSKSNISRDLGPYKVKVIGAEPHVFAAAADRIGSGGAVILRGAGMQDHANVLLIFKNAERPCGAVLRGKHRDGCENTKGDGCRFGQGQQYFSGIEGLSRATKRGLNACRPIAVFLSAKMRGGFQPERRISHRAAVPKAIEGRVIARNHHSR